MYKRIIYDSALDWVPYLAFGVTAAVFLTFVVRAFKLRKESADKLSRIPLDDWRIETFTFFFAMTPQSPNNGPVLRDHTYDGIQEYDQKLPNWWLFTWYITMVWFVIAWVAYYQLSLGESGEEQVDKALANIKAVQLKELEKLTDEKLWAMSQDEKIVGAGAATFATTCVACHAPDLSAKIAGAKLPGLPLNDTEWKHGNNPLQLLGIVRKGAPDLTKGMPPWEPQLGLNRVVEVVAFVLSKHKKDGPSLAADSPLKK